MNGSLYPLLYQVNTRVWLTELSAKFGFRATLDDIPDSELDSLAKKGFEWIWFLSVWQTGSEAQEISRHNPEWRTDFIETLPDLVDEDIMGSGFAITEYVVHELLGGDEALARLRKRLSDRGMKLMLDFVPHHTAPDDSWVSEHPEYYINSTEASLYIEPESYIRINRKSGDKILAKGRDPFFPGWPDTLQLNYGNPDLQKAMTGELMRIAGQCDGVRCDMAMLVLPDVFETTWSIKCENFWPEAIRRVRVVNHEFCFMAEVYWDLEWTLLQQGFDYTYDKRLYDRLKEGHAKPVRDHLYAPPDYQGKMARFLENHDEPRVASEFSVGMHEAAAIITFLTPGLRFFHQGQFRGRKKRISPHLIRAPQETVNKELEKFYLLLLDIINRPVFKNGLWQLADCVTAWDGNLSNENYISFSWQGIRDENMLVAVNYSHFKSQCYVKLQFQDFGTETWIFYDLFSGNTFEREGQDLNIKGLYLDEPAWRFFVFSIKPKSIS